MLLVCCQKMLIFPEVNLYKIGSVNPAIKNNLQDPPSTDCKIGFKVPISTTDVRITYNKIPTATKKYANPRHRSSSSVSSRNRIQQLKYNAILAGQMVNNNYNCVNGQLCSLYGQPGNNTKSIMGLDRIARCTPARVNGLRQSCPV